MNPLYDHEQTLIRGGHQSFFGAFAQQNPRAFLSFNRLLNAHCFDTIVELGTHDAGLSTMFALYAYLARKLAYSSNPDEPVLYKNNTHHRRDKAFVTYDIVRRDESAIDVISHLDGLFVQADTLNDEEIIAGIRRQLSNPTNGRVLLLCDGGNKKRELELYGSALKSGDFVGLHDWARDEAAFESNKARGVWHGWEVRMTNGVGPDQQFGIESLCAAYGIEPIYATEFDDSAWFMGVKR